ncbi:hypothetical protein G6K97_11405 [Agrobacterium rhizogenes]|nr:hypothetical protein [Rhizobium rhizogenes]NTH77734.1 hypothetical protein [Rhizobium rhizogenes]NTH83742.1 hypothetical protein [Rhizobium rhizogenes]NTI75144.1 hypothetical protein [Rhizobium rhizogenes]
MKSAKPDRRSSEYECRVSDGHANEGCVLHASEVRRHDHAWTLYHRDTRLRRPLTAAGRRRWFAHSLATAWIWARQQATDATKTEDQHRAERLTGLKLELLRIDARPFGMSIAKNRTALLEEIDLLTAQSSASATRMAA